MNKAVWKFEINIRDRQIIVMPKKSEILSMQIQSGFPCIWALVNTHESEKTKRYIETFGTGQPIPYDMGVSRTFLGTYQLNGLVFHVFENHYGFN